MNQPVRRMNRPGAGNVRTTRVATEDAEASQEELEAANCWERDDRVPGRPEMTAFRRRIRLQQAQWRAAQGHQLGTQPIRGSESGTRPPH